MYGDKQDDLYESSFFVSRGSLDNTETYTKTQVRSMVQAVLSDSVNLSTFIGSGASVPEVPLMGKSFSNFRQSYKDKDALDTKICEFLKMSPSSDSNSVKEDKPNNDKSDELKGFKDIESFLSWLDYRIKGNADDSGKDRRLFDDIVHDLISSIKKGDSAAAQSSTSETSKNYQKVIQGLGESRKILNAHGVNHSDIVNLFTTNYDLCHERALEASRYVYTDGFTTGINNTFSMTEFHRRPADLDNRFKNRMELIVPFFRLVKLHGSINWKTSNGQITRSHDVKDEEVLISPTSSKFALTQDEPYSDLFREFVNILAAPNTVLFTAGFSFGDAHIAKLIRNALERPDFTLYAFVPDPRSTDSTGLAKFYAEVKSANAFFIYPAKDKNGKDAGKNAPLQFTDFADFFAPSTFVAAEEGQANESTESSNKDGSGE